MRQGARQHSGEEGALGHNAGTAWPQRPCHLCSQAAVCESPQTAEEIASTFMLEKNFLIFALHFS